LLGGFNRDAESKYSVCGCACVRACVRVGSWGMRLAEISSFTSVLYLNRPVGAHFILALNKVRAPCEGRSVRQHVLCTEVLIAFCIGLLRLHLSIQFNTEVYKIS
jgi:hypothetical protein